MRSATLEEIAAIDARKRLTYVRVKVGTALGVMQNMHTLGGVNWVAGVSIDEDIDQPVATCTVTFKREQDTAAGLLSLSPLRTDSEVNADGPAVDVSRILTVDVAVVEGDGARPAEESSAWKRKFTGVTDDVSFAGKMLVATARDEGNALVDQWVTDEGNSIPSGDPWTMQELLDALLAFVDVNGAIPESFVPVDPEYMVTRFQRQQEPVMRACARAAELVVGDFRYFWDDADGIYKPTLIIPDRDDPDVAATIAPSSIAGVKEIKTNRLGVKNIITVNYRDAATGARANVTVSDGPSILLYGIRRLVIREDDDSPIDSAAEATDMGNFVLADTKDPKVNFEVDVLPDWRIELHDYLTFAPTRYFDLPLSLAIVGITHDWQEHRQRSTLRGRGKPSAGYRRWLLRAATSDSSVQPPEASIALVTRQRSRETVSLEGALRDPTQAPLEYAVAIGDGDFTAYTSSPALPLEASYNRAVFYDTPLRLRVRQADGQIDEASYSIPARGIDGATVDREDDRRAGTGGTPTPLGRIRPDPVYSDDGTTPLIDPATRRFTTGISGPTGIPSTTIETGGNRGFGGFTNLSGGLVNTASDSRSALLNAHFRYGTDGADGVVESGAKGFAHPTYLDASRRPKLLRDQTLGADVDANDINVGQARARGGFTNSTGGLASTAVDSRSALLNAHFRYGTDSTNGVVDGTGSPLSGGQRGFLALNTSNRLTTGVTSAATGADGYAGIESRRGAARQAGLAAQGIVHEGNVRAGNGGVPTPRGQIATDPIYSSDGATPLIDPVTREMKAGLAIGSGVRGAGDVAFGATVKYPTSRHNEDILGKHNEAKNFGVSYEQVPNIRAIPLCYALPGSAAKIEVKVVNVTVSGFEIRAVSSTGATSSSETDSFAPTLNGTEASSVAISTPGSAAYCNLDDANTTLTTYKVVYNVNTTAMDPGVIMRVRVYKNNGTGSTSWTQVASRNYDAGLTLTDEILQFDAAMAANWDVQVVVSYSSTPLVNGTVDCKRVDYNKITAGTESNMTLADDAAVLVQATEVS